MDHPVVSIIIPVFNIEPFIEECIESCLNQKFTDFELIIVNDGSTDGTKEKLMHFESNDSRVKIINKENEGVNFARKTGIESATGEYIFFLDGDDYIPQSTLQSLIENASTSHADIIAGDVLIHELNGETTYRYYNKFNNETGISFLAFILQNKLHYLWGKLIKRSLFVENDILFRRELVIGEDQVQLYQLCMYAKKVAVVKGIVYHYRKNNMSASQKSSATSFVKNQETYAICIRELQEKFNYNRFIQQQLNFRIIFALIQSAYRNNKKYHDKRVVSRLLKKAIIEGVFKQPSLLNGSSAIIFKGIVTYISPSLTYTLRKVLRK